MANPNSAFANKELVALRLEEYRHPYWLKSGSGDACIIGDFGDAGTVRLNLNRPTEDFGHEELSGMNLNGMIPDGLDLMDESHRRLREDIALILGMQTHRDITTRKRSERRDRNVILRTATVIDYFLVRAEEFGLPRLGFGGIAENNLRQFLVEAAGHPESAQWVYRWRDNLDRLIDLSAEKVSELDLEAARQAYPEIDEVDDEQMDLLGRFNTKQIVNARAFLFKHKLFKRSSCLEYEWIPDARKLSTLFYSGTLRGTDTNYIWPIPRELCWQVHDRYDRECSNASFSPLESNDGVANAKNFAEYRRCLLSLKQLAKCGRGVSLSAVEAIEKFDYRAALKLKRPGRTFTLPPSYVLTCMGKAIDFFVEHGEHLLDSYFNVLKAAKDARKSIREFDAGHDIKPFCRPETLRLGVKWFGLKVTLGNASSRRRGKNAAPRVARGEYFNLIRSCAGLAETVQVLLGGIAFTIGSLMAARDGELDDLKTGECLSETGRWLTFATRKSGVPSHRRDDDRPVPEIAQKMIELLDRFHSRCQRAKMPSGDKLFRLPERRRAHGNKIALDLFIDFIDAPKLEDGSRYYVRQHMLRRFFAIVFFCHAGLQGLGPLRWMLRHTDMEHLYHYITESIPGGILRTVKAAAASMMVRAGDEEYGGLSDFLRRYLGTDRFDVMTESELARHIVYLQEMGAVVIEPVFLDHKGKKQFKIGVQIWETAVAAMD
ncbi:hypothetical protein [Burkholderia lata]|uniref:hypothetical protein n=1 Tax=Burkholderia lata (strain ATCC 17760 / DSM 23089 / LMG 22485 / NCIMB 9086 / R18194 / 383) TaxID=482957 RepID=UPI0014547340|nr:hypothetical protein [Burkholderia lata]VWB31492.1 hypothetical protein BLA15816_01360 [Burkholderia lata]